MFTDLRIPAGRRPLTRSEARISAVFGTVFTLLILAAIFEEYSPRKLSIVFIIVFWVPMLVVHELGHALAAKLLGWRVREIVIGFGRDLWQFRVGNTVVKLKLVPVEGYVLPAPREATSVRVKSLLIYAAGPGIELAILGALIIALGWDTVFNDTDDIGRIALHSLAIVILYGAGFNLLPFRTDGAVSDGLGILSSPFIPDEAIQLRLLTFELRAVRKMLDSGAGARALHCSSDLLGQYPDNTQLKLLYAETLSADGQDDRARDYVRARLDTPDLADPVRRAWLHRQALTELDATEPSYLTLDLALQKALKITPDANDLLVTKGASLVLRGDYQAGGTVLADAWRRNDPGTDDATMLAYLTIAAHKFGDRAASSRFAQSFERVNRSAHLSRRVRTLAASVIS